MTITHELLKIMPSRTMYNRMNKMKKIARYSISNKVAFDVVASLAGIDVQKILSKQDDGSQELADFKDAMSRFDFESGEVKRNKVVKPEKRKDAKSPYYIPLGKYEIDRELVKDCRIQYPYRKPVSEALLTLETRMRKTLKAGDSVTGISLVSEADKQGVFDRSVQLEHDGLNLLYRGAFLWFRNPQGHRKVEYSKEDAVKIVLFTDYLIRLFDDLHNKKI
jgi:Protein of unknown function (Hypoth_ymh)